MAVVPSFREASEDLAAFIRASQGTIDADNLNERLLQERMDSRTRGLAHQDIVEDFPSPEPVATDWLPPQEDTGQPSVTQAMALFQADADTEPLEALPPLLTVAQMREAGAIFESREVDVDGGPTMAQMVAARDRFEAGSDDERLADALHALPEVQSWLGRMVYEPLNFQDFALAMTEMCAAQIVHMQELAQEEEPYTARENSRGVYLCESCFDAMTDRVLSADQSGTGMAMAQCVACAGEGKS